MKNQKGVSLIALIVTIAVLLVLASVTIRTIGKSKIIDQTQEIKQGYEELSINEAEKYNQLKQDILQGKK